MGFTLKKISLDGVDAANAKAERYRFLNQPHEAESICLDVLEVDPENQLAWRNLALAITDQFSGARTDRFNEAERALEKVRDPYERLYYSGIMHERRAKTQLRAGNMPHALLVVFENALRCFEQAQAISPPANDNAILHWNSCVRVLQSRGDADWHQSYQESGSLESGDSGSGPSV
jgi:tetratricopeptide (TPR) repeat protein